MRENFERNQNLEYYVNWKNNYYQFNEKNFIKQSISHLNEVCEPPYYYETTFIRKRLDPLSITDDTLSSLLASSFEQKHILLDSKTFYIKDIRDVADTPFNTIVFQLDAPSLKTEESSRTIMNRYFDQRPLDYNIIQYFGKGLGFHHRCPFVSGDEIFVPEKGSANDSTSWYGIHHILYANEDKKTKCMQVHFRGHHELQLNISARSFNEQVDRSAVLFIYQQFIIDELVSLGHYVQEASVTTELNIVQQHLKKFTFTMVLHPLEKILYYISNYRVQETLGKVLGEGNPYIGEIRDDFNSNFKK